MLRSTLVAAVLAFALALAPGGCRRDFAATPVYSGEGDDVPPLPPASGTHVGYLIDNAGALDLRDDQLDELKKIDTSLAARNDSIETQLRAMIRPDEQPAEKGQPPPRHNNAPGAQVKTTGDVGKLQQAKEANDREALAKAFALLDDAQQETARKLLEARGITPPGSKKEAPARDAADGVPLEP